MTRSAYVLVLAALLVGCGKNSQSTNSASNDATRLPDIPKGGFKTLGIEDLEPGHGDPVKKGDTVVVFYRGTFVDGTVFDSNMDENHKPNPEKDPYPVVVGAGGVIKGWDEGLVGVKEGAIRKLKVPYKMAYGEEGQGDKIPPRSDMVFTIKIAKVIKQGTQAEIEGTDIKVGTGTAVTPNSTVTMKYKGSLLNGKVFDDRTDKAITVPVSKLIPGFKEVILGMKPGGKRKVSWPPGSPNPTGQIPANQPVEYEVEIISVK